MTIKDSGENGAIDVAAGKGIYVSSGKLTLEGGALSVHSSSTYTYGVQVGSDGEFEMTGGSITIPTSSTSTYNYPVSNSGTTTIIDGEITAQGSGGNYAVNSTGGTVTIEGGYINAIVGYGGTWGLAQAPYALYITGGHAYVSGGYIKAVGDTNEPMAGYILQGSATISGGYFGGIYYYGVTASNLASGYMLKTLTSSESNEDDAAAYTAGYQKKVVPDNSVAQIGETKYETLAEAITAANASTAEDVTITLLADCDTGAATINNPLALTKAGAVLDLNGNTITVPGNFSFVMQGDGIEVKNGSIISGTNAAKQTKINSYILVVNDCDGVKLTDLTMMGGVSIGGSQDDWGTVATPTIDGVHGADKATNVVITGCDITSGDYYALCSQMNSTATINGGKFTANTANDCTSSRVLHGYFTGTDGPQGSIFVTDGQFIGKINNDNAGWIVISGGIFTDQPDDGLIKTGYQVIDNPDDATKNDYPYTVKFKYSGEIAWNAETDKNIEIRDGMSVTNVWLMLGAKTSGFNLHDISFDSEDADEFKTIEAFYNYLLNLYLETPSIQGYMDQYGVSYLKLKYTSIVFPTVDVPAEEAVCTVDEVGYRSVKLAVDAIANSDSKTGTIVMVQDYTTACAVEIPEGVNVTLDLAGYTLTGGASASNRSVYAIENYGTFTLVDSGTGGTITSRGIWNKENATMTVNSGTVVDQDQNGGAAVWNEGNLVINDGTFSTTYVGSASETVGPACLSNQATGTAQINGGLFQSVNNRAYAVMNYGTMVVDNATVDGTHGGISCDTGSLTINGGSYTAKNYYGCWVTNNSSSTSVIINGGSFKGGSVGGYGLLADVDDGGQDVGNATVLVTKGYFESGNAGAAAFAKGGKQSNNVWKLCATGGVFKGGIDASYVAEGYEAVLLSSANGYGGESEAYNGWYKVGEKYTQQSTTDTTVTDTDGNTTTSTAFAVDTTNATPTYAIKTQVTTTVENETPTTTTTYTEVDVNTATAAEVATNVASDESDEAASARAAVTAYNSSTGSANFTATIDNSEASAANVLKTAAAANAIAKAAAQETVNVSEIKEAKVILQTTLKAVGTNGENATVTYDITPVAQLYNESGAELGNPVALNNEDIEEGQTFTFTIPVPANMTGNIKVSHVGSNGYATEIGTYTPVGENGEVRYITVTVDHFSDFELEETTVATLGTAKVAANLSLQDEIKINFRVHSINQGADNYHVEYKFGNNELVSKSLSEADDTTNGYKFVVASCAAKQMTDTVTFRLYCGDAMIFSVEYSIRQYCVNKINANTDPKLVALCRSLLDYGAEAQEYFNYEATNLANADNYGNGTLPSIDAGYNHLITSGLVSYTNGITNVKANLTLVSRTELNFKLTAADVSKITDVIVTSSGNESVMWTDSTSGDVMTIKVNGISAKYLDHVYTLSFNYDGTSNSIEYSPLTYAYRNQNKTSDNLGNLCKALYQYWYTAKAYLN